jgi:hypothetical protein
VKKYALVASAAAAVAVWFSLARAHVGAQVAVAKIMTPADPMIVNHDPNDTFPPFQWTMADQSYVVTWVDGDTDPTGQFVFYYLDHHPTFQVSADEIQMIGTRIDDPVNNTGGYYASCYCSGDLGVTCPMVTRDMATNCANQITWNTGAVAPGTYWLVAVNNDPPFHTYYASNAPLRVAHGGTPLPAVLIIRPDGYGSWDTTYHLQWMADGKGPLTFDLQYGLEDTTTSLTPQATIATGLSLTPGSDGTYTYDWDVSQLDNNKAYWVQIKATDADGNSTFTQSYFAVTVFHSGGMVTTPPDMAPPKTKHGCQVGQMGSPADDDTPARSWFSMLLVLAALATALYFARRAARRG